MTASADSASDKKTRLLIRVAALLQTLFFVFAMYYIVQRIGPKSSGFEIMAIGPMVLIFVLLVLPSLLLTLSKRASMLFPALLCLFALAANYFMFGEVVATLGR
jgi:fucose 4-O-acetylase-like acetyltransferase